MQSIIFVNRYFYPDHSATSQILTDLAFHLAQSKNKIKIITSRQLYEDPSKKLPGLEQVNSVSIVRVWSTRFGRINLLGRAVDYLTFYISAFIVMLLTVKRDDYLVAKTDPPMISVFANIVAWLKGAKLINWTQDLFPEIGTELGVKILELTKPALLALRNITLKNAWMNVVIGEAMRDKLLELGVSISKIRFIPNWSDGEVIFPVKADENPLRKQWNLQDKFIVGYSGNMGRAHEFETILNIAEILKDDNNIVFVFIGNGAKKKWLVEEVKRKGLNNVLFKPYQVKENLYMSLSLPDLHFISLLPKLEGLIVPSKYYGVAAAGRPCLFIGDRNGEIARIVERFRCGQVIEPGDINKGIQFIKELKNNKNEHDKMCMNARNMYIENFDKQIAFKQWENLLSVA